MAPVDSKNEKIHIERDKRIKLKKYVSLAMMPERIAPRQVINIIQKSVIKYHPVYDQPP